MDYKALAIEFLDHSRRFKKRRHQKKIDEKMHGEIYALVYLFFQDKAMTPGDISNELNVSSARTAAVLNRLEEKGLILRSIAPEDRRKILVTLTEAGRASAEAHHDTMLQTTAEMLQGLGEADARELVRLTSRLADLPIHTQAKAGDEKGDS